MSEEKKLSKRQAMRVQRQKKERQQRVIIIGAIVVTALVIVLLFAVPAIQEMNTPVEFKQITPIVWSAPIDGTTIGDPNAPVTIEVFEDFQCSACLSFSTYIEPQVISELVETGQVYYIFRNFPFLDDNSAIKDSDNAAMGTMCAAEQDRFWDYKAILFENYGYGPGGFSDRRLVTFAESLDMDSDEFSQCLSENRYQDLVNQDLADGNAYGVTGTPSVFVNGVNIKPGYVPTFEDIMTAVNAEIAGG